MQISYASDRGVGRVNEDYVIGGTNWAVILDGATAAPGVETGCVHDVQWLVHRLASALAARMLNAKTPLDDVLSAAIQEVCGAHASTCDLSNPDSPSSTVSIARVTDASTLDYLVLADSPVVLWDSREKTAQAFEDERIAHLPGGRPYTRGLIRASRNVPGGFWVASTRPEAAYHAIRGTVSLEPEAEVALFTDGITRLVDFYQHTWDSLFGLLRDVRPQGLIEYIRESERKHQVPYGKRHDDATVAYITAI